MLWQLLIKITNSVLSSPLSSFIEQESHRDYKRTQQEVPNVFLHYIYYKYMVHTSNK